MKKHNFHYENPNSRKVQQNCVFSIKVHYNFNKSSIPSKFQSFFPTKSMKNKLRKCVFKKRCRLIQKNMQSTKKEKEREKTLWNEWLTKLFVPWEQWNFLCFSEKDCWDVVNEGVHFLHFWLEFLFTISQLSWSEDWRITKEDLNFKGNWVLIHFISFFDFDWTKIQINWIKFESYSIELNQLNNIQNWILSRIDSGKWTFFAETEWGFWYYYCWWHINESI